jgi:Fe-S cluster biogenesis protein NfuA
MPGQNLRASGERIDLLLDELQSGADPRCYALASEALALVSELYGAGLARVVELVDERSPELLEALTGDDLVASLLVVHGLHPESLEGRVERALEQVRPLLGAHGGDVELLGLDPDAGEVRLRLLGSCDGCPSSSVTLHLAVERAINELAPEIVRIDVDDSQSSEPVSVPVSLGPTATYDGCPTELARS